MRAKKTDILISTIIAIGISAVILIIFCVIVEMKNNGNFYLNNYSYTKMAIATLVIGLGFGIPSCIYSNERLSLFVKTFIHLAIGTIVMTIALYFSGLIPKQIGLFEFILIILEQIAIEIAIWLIFYIRQKKLASKMNEKIRK